MTEQKNKHLLLIIEDNPLLIGMYKAAFEKKGVEVSLAHDGDSGIQLAKDRKPDVIILDLLMPGTDGMQVLRALKNDSTTKDIKVVVLTIVPKAEKLAEAEKLGIVDYLLKSELELHEIVDKVLAHFGDKER